MSNISLIHSPAQLAIPREWTVFPLHGFVEDTAASKGLQCLCGKLDCQNWGKHPKWLFSQLQAGEKAPIGEGDGIGLATGERSGVVVIDLDWKPVGHPKYPAGLNGLEEFAALIGAGGIPPTLMVATPGNGFHLYFQWPGFKCKNSVSELAPGVDVRGDGGYVVLPPTRHKSGGVYEFVNWGTPIAPLPEWIAGRLATGSSAATIAPPIARPDLPENLTTQDGWDAIDRATRVITTASDGRRNATLFQVCAALGDRAYVGDLNLEDARHAIRTAIATAGWSDPDKTLDTMERGFEKGRNKARPLIVVGADLHRVVTEACEALAADDHMFQRQGELVRMVRVLAREVDGVPEGTPVLRAVHKATLRGQMTAVADWRRRQKGELLRIVPSDDVVDGVLRACDWPGVRPVVGFAEAPILRADGSILQVEGYDAATALIYQPGEVVFPPVPEAPTFADARAALAFLLEPFADFPVESEAHRLVGPAAVLTILAKGALEHENFPAFLFDANVRGAGKTLMAEVVSWICQGRDVAKQRFPATDKEELEKILGAMARAATALVCFDNLGPGIAFGGDALETRMTCRGVSQFRILGKTENATLPWRAVILATGNNVEVTGDMCRRTLRCRLLSPLEDPENRTDFRHADLRAWTLEHRPALVVAGLTILRAFVAAGRTETGVPAWGSFEGWSRLVAGSLAWVSGVDVQGARIQDDADVDPVAGALGALLATFPEDQLGKGYTLAELDRIPSVREVFETIAPGLEKGRTRSLGMWLGKQRDRNVGGRMLKVGKDPKAKIARYSVRRV